MILWSNGWVTRVVFFFFFLPQKAHREIEILENFFCYTNVIGAEETLFFNVGTDYRGH